jgi:hypothetical protein
VTCDQRRDLLLLYVSDALEADEAAELRHHLASGCIQCAGYLAEAQAVMASIPLGLDPISPPPDLKAKLMKRIDAASTPMRSTSQETAFGDSLPIRLFRYLVPAAVAAGFAMMLTHYVMNQKLAAVRQQATAAQAALIDKAMLQFQLNEMTRDLNSKTQIVDMLQSPDAKLVHLTHTDLQPNAVANLLWDQKRQQWAILTSGMKQPPKGETYELWFVTDKGAFAAGEFDVDANGNGSLAVNIPAGIGQLQKAAVTNEIAGGVKVPAGHFQVLGAVE